MSLPIHRNQETHHEKPQESSITFDFEDNGGFELDNSREDDKPITLPTEQEYEERRNKEIGNHGDRNPFLADEPDYSLSIEQDAEPVEEQRDVRREDNEHLSKQVIDTIQGQEAEHDVYQDTANEVKNADNGQSLSLDAPIRKPSTGFSLKNFANIDGIIVMLSIIIIVCALLGYAFLHISISAVLSLVALSLILESGLMIYHKYIKHEKQDIMPLISCILSVLAILLVII